MAICNEYHKKLTNGKGKCSVPMWCMGVPAGFCDKDAFGFRLKPKKYINRRTRLIEFDYEGRYDGYVPYLACPAHGGPKCPGIEIEPGVFSGCDQSFGDCPTCGK